MATFDFKRFHLRSINAHSEAERAAINQELKALYASLSSEEQQEFNEQLQAFLVREMGRLKSDFDSVKGMNSAN
ncbi:hypothetical protein GCM10027275_56020 [Rhabdobacter roseus]|uniref:Transcriptional regulator n=1 Tax=Rhabdobacter roseus TaxID=1655419 RepID=A0A840U724_9BACT|nr:hypothetical protein [Rhabdobacter roseus]MBB5287619.1 hypothetical protein [Rhabdobacter roseus]